MTVEEGRLAQKPVSYPYTVGVSSVVPQLFLYDVTSDRIESLVSQEHAQWASATSKTEKSPAKTG